MQPPGPGIPPSAPPPRPQPRAKSQPATTVWILAALCIGGGFGATCATCATISSPAGDDVFFGGGERVGVIDLLGPIVDATDTIRNIRSFTKRKDLVAIVVRIDSPGGAVAPSQEIFQALRAASKKKPVVASMGSVAASGGFWASLGADWVFASPGTITGSIGVIMQTSDLRGIADLARVKFHTFKSGPLKDAGNPFREVNELDQSMFMAMIEDVYEQFVQVTAKRRELDLATVKSLADGRILTGKAALEAGLIDQLGGLHDAARKAVLLAQIREAEEEGTTTSTTVDEEMEDPTLVYPKKKSAPLMDLLGDAVGTAVSEGISSGVERTLRSSVEMR